MEALKGESAPLGNGAVTETAAMRATDDLTSWVESTRAEIFWTRPNDRTMANMAHLILNETTIAILDKLQNLIYCL